MSIGNSAFSSTAHPVGKPCPEQPQITKPFQCQRVRVLRLGKRNSGRFSGRSTVTVAEAPVTDPACQAKAEAVQVKRRIINGSTIGSCSNTDRGSNVVVNLNKPTNKARLHRGTQTRCSVPRGPPVYLPQPCAHS